MTMEVVRYVEANKKTHLATLAAEFMVEEADGQPLLTHLTSVVSAQLPKMDKRDPPTKPNLSRLITATPPPGGEVDRPLEGEMYGMLDKKTKKLQRRVRPRTFSLCPWALVCC